jgi:trk system potassium uptake protein TrkA
LCLNSARAIGSDIEASILSASLIVRRGVRDTWAKAESDAHGTILSQIGVQHVVYPEYEMGRRVARLVRCNMQDYLEVDHDIVMIKTTPHAALVGKTLWGSQIRSVYGVTVSAIKPRDSDWGPATADMVLAADDIILVTGQMRFAEAFAQMR